MEKKQTELEYFISKTKKVFIYNFIKFIISLAIACSFAVVSSNYWGHPIIALPLIPVFFSSFYILVFILRMHKNVRDYRTLSELNEYADSLDVESMENKEE